MSAQIFRCINIDKVGLKCNSNTCNHDLTRDRVRMKLHIFHISVIPYLNFFFYEFSHFSEKLTSNAICGELRLSLPSISLYYSLYYHFGSIAPQNGMEKATTPFFFLAFTFCKMLSNPISIVNQEFN